MAMTPTAVSAVYAGSVVHHRMREPAHRFRYRVYMWLLDLDEIPTLGTRVRGFGYNRRRPVAFYDADHFAGTSEPVGAQVRRLIEARGHAWPGGPVRVLTSCRILGYVFNPVSFWYCLDPDERVRVVVAEVNNTFGERHCYVGVPVVARAAGAPTWARWTDKKVFHVSPFLSLDGTYAFTLEEPGERLRAHIDLTIGEERCLAASLSLVRAPLGRGSVLRVLAQYPLMTARIMAAIHWEALRLRSKGAAYRPKPPYDPEAARQGVP